MFPSPRRGPIFSTKRKGATQVAKRVSVPTKGTHLLYRIGNISKTGSGLSVSVPTKGTHLLYEKQEALTNALNEVSVPTKGTHLLYVYKEVEDGQYKVSVPTKGTHLLYMG